MPSTAVRPTSSGFWAGRVVAPWIISHSLCFGETWIVTSRPSTPAYYNAITRSKTLHQHLRGEPVHCAWFQRLRIYVVSETRKARRNLRFRSIVLHWSPGKLGYFAVHVFTNALSGPLSLSFDFLHDQLCEKSLSRCIFSKNSFIGLLSAYLSDATKGLGNFNTSCLGKSDNVIY